VGWFHNWFGTKYYKLLYRHRDETEAVAFLDRLAHHIQLPPYSKILDVACGNGRHAYQLAKMGHEVIGFDVSEVSIHEANNGRPENAHFFVHDMRLPFPVHGFHLALNLFTSFGYFQTEKEDLAVLQNIYDALVFKGLFILDFLNSDNVKQCLVPEQCFQLDGIRFLIRKMLRGNLIIKDIYVTEGDQRFHFEESVKLLTFDDFHRYLHLCRFRILEVFGNYELGIFEPDKSERLIIIAQKEA
jgi:SAM-dependent methyltransferase